MALEIAPVPAKTTPSKAAERAVPGRGEVVDGASGQVGRGKSDKSADPAGFLALLMGLGQDLPPAGLSDDPIAQGSEATEVDGKEVPSDLTAAAAVAVATTPTVDTSVVPGVALHEFHQAPANDRNKPEDPAGALTLAISDKGVSAGRSRLPASTNTAVPMGTQQLQREGSKESPARFTELINGREAKDVASVVRVEIPLQQVLASSLPNEDVRKASHSVQTKAEIADNLVVLSSGLSGAMTMGAGAGAGPSGNVAQFQSVVAQEVAYYVSQDVQSAEMKLEGVGGGPVEVSINMQGQEAQVVFRTNELQTREMLEGATTQLRDLLQQQGVTLTGVFVGGSGAGESGQHQERKFRQGSRSETTLRIAAPESRRSGTPAVGVGRTLDLFV